MADENRRLLESLYLLEELLDVDTWREYTTKCNEESTRSRNEGNVIYAAPYHQRQHHMSIIRWYTRAVAYAEPGTRELGLAHGNRSAALVHVARYEDAIRDLDEALQTDIEDALRAKYMLRKVECQAELGMTEAENTCAEMRTLLQDMDASEEFKKDMVMKLVDAVVKLRTGMFEGPPEVKRKLELPNAAKFSSQRSSEHACASSALSIAYDPRYPSQGRHLLATRSVPPGEVLYAGEPYLSCPTEQHLHSNCSHCLRFAWAGLPCPGCPYAVYCCAECRETAWQEYHEAECRVIGRIWKVRGEGNAGRLMALRLTLKSLKEAGGLERLMTSLDEIDNSKESRRKGFNARSGQLENEFGAAYSLQGHARKKSSAELRQVSEDSAVVLHLLARYTPLFRRHFEYDARALVASDEALFVGRLLSHYQHIVLINACAVRDVEPGASTDWSWSSAIEAETTGLYLNPFISLINHSCYPNVVKCEMEDRRTLLFAIRPILKGEKIFCSYGPVYADLPKDKRRRLLANFHFSCDCFACENDWPEFSTLVNTGVTYLTLSPDEVNACVKAQEKAEKIVESLRDRKDNIGHDDIQELGYAIVLTLAYCRLPNWRLPSLTTTLVAVFHHLYGYVPDVPDDCKAAAAAAAAAAALQTPDASF